MGLKAVKMGLKSSKDEFLKGSKDGLKAVKMGFKRQ